MPDKYWNKHFLVEFTIDGFPPIEVRKSSGGGWAHIVRGDNEITLTSREQLEQLHFSLGQLLKD